MAVEKLTKTDALLMIYNQLIQQLAATQLDEKVMRKMQLISVTMNPELSKALTSTQDTIAKLKNTLVSLEDMLDAETKTATKVRESN